MNVKVFIWYNKFGLLISEVEQCLCFSQESSKEGRDSAQRFSSPDSYERALLNLNILDDQCNDKMDNKTKELGEKLELKMQERMDLEPNGSNAKMGASKSVNNQGQTPKLDDTIKVNADHQTDTETKGPNGKLEEKSKDQLEVETKEAEERDLPKELSCDTEKEKSESNDVIMVSPGPSLPKKIGKLDESIEGVKEQQNSHSKQSTSKHLISGGNRNFCNESINEPERSVNKRSDSGRSVASKTQNSLSRPLINSLRRSAPQTTNSAEAKKLSTKKAVSSCENLVSKGNSKPNKSSHTPINSQTSKSKEGRPSRLTPSNSLASQNRGTKSTSERKTPTRFKSTSSAPRDSAKKTYVGPSIQRNGLVRPALKPINTNPFVNQPTRPPQKANERQIAPPSKVPPRLAKTGLQFSKSVNRKMGSNLDDLVGPRANSSSQSSVQPKKVVKTTLENKENGKKAFNGIRLRSGIPKPRPTLK